MCFLCFLLGFLNSHHLQLWELDLHFSGQNTNFLQNICKLIKNAMIRIAFHPRFSTPLHLNFCVNTFPPSSCGQMTPALPDISCAKSKYRSLWYKLQGQCEGRISTTIDYNDGFLAKFPLPTRNGHPNQTSIASMDEGPMVDNKCSKPLLMSLTWQRAAAAFTMDVHWWCFLRAVVQETSLQIQGSFNMISTAKERIRL